MLSKSLNFLISKGVHAYPDNVAAAALHFCKQPSFTGEFPLQMAKQLEAWARRLVIFQKQLLNKLRATQSIKAKQLRLVRFMALAQVLSVMKSQATLSMNQQKHLKFLRILKIKKRETATFGLMSNLK